MSDYWVGYSTDVPEKYKTAEIIGCHVNLEDGKDWLTIGLWNFKQETEEEARKKLWDREYSNLQISRMNPINDWEQNKGLKVIGE